VALAERFQGMLPWEAKARTLEAGAEDVLPLLELLGHEAQVAADTASVGPDDFYEDEYDATCGVCNPRRPG
jgi:hypothetical protein